MVPFEKALVSFYRPSIVTFPLSLRHFFPAYYFIVPQNFLIFPGSIGGYPLGYEERRSWANCSCN